MYKKSNFFVSLGMLVYSIVWTTWTRKYWVGALQRLAVVVLQLHPVVHVIESIQVGIETTGCELDNVLLNLMIFNIDGIPDFLDILCMFCRFGHEVFRGSLRKHTSNRLANIHNVFGVSTKWGI
jgi:hypothetical protein